MPKVKVWTGWCPLSREGRICARPVSLAHRQSASPCVLCRLLFMPVCLSIPISHL